MSTEPYRITIETHGCKYAAELPPDGSLDNITDALRGLLVAAGWSMDTVLEYLPIPE